MLGAQGGYDVLVLDRMLPGLDGLSLLKSLRAAGNHSPAIFLTALGSIDERVAGLEVAEDYLVKPFAFAELYARIGSLARRPAAKQEQTLLECGELSMDLLRRKVMRGQREISLQPTEFRLLEFLMRHAGQVVTRTMLLESVWEFHFDPKTNIVETHISRLRAKLNQDEEADVLRTVRGAGYVLDDTHSA
jgi:two-component system OmpR family response regulator